jgi:hypothetical protein
MMSTTLPPELLEHVFSYLAEEKICLHSCSLTCRAWRDVAQAALFRDTRLHLHRRLPWMVPDQIRDAGVIAPLLHRLLILEIIFTNTPETSTGEAANSVDHHLMFKPKPCRGDLCLSKVKCDVRQDLLKRWDLATSLLYAITTLELYGAVFDHFTALRDVLCGLPALERLALSAAKVQQQDVVPPYTGLRLRSFKSAISYGGSDQVVVRVFLTWLATAEDPQLEKMCLELSEPVVSALHNVLVACAPSIRMLQVHNLH